MPGKSKYHRWISHKTYKVLINDYARLDAAEVLVALAQNADYIISNRFEQLIVLLDGTDSSVDEVGLKQLYETAQSIQPYIKRVAVIGIPPIQRAVIDFISKTTGVPTKAFDTQELALDWLILALRPLPGRGSSRPPSPATC